MKTEFKFFFCCCLTILSHIWPGIAILQNKLGSTVLGSHISTKLDETLTRDFLINILQSDLSKYKMATEDLITN